MSEPEESFNLISCPLTGVNLIEAGAGTGKTYALTGLFLRLLIEKKIDAPKILVITFTNAATAELRKRIRDIIYQMKSALIRGDGFDKDPLVCELAANCDDPETKKSVIELLGNVLANFDETAIFTIHGFCQRLLMDNAFESGLLFDMPLLENQKQMEREFVEDFWRRRIYGLSPELAGSILASGFNLETLALLFRKIMSKINVEIIAPDRIPTDAEIEADLQALGSRFDEVARLWMRERLQIEEKLRDSALSGVTYGSKVNKILADLETALLPGQCVLPLPSCLDKISVETLEAKTKKGQNTPAHPVFDETAALCRKAQDVAEKFSSWMAGLKTEFALSAVKDFPQIKEHKRVMYFDDLLLKARRAVTRDGAGRLVSALREKYAAVLIDEFQDTDPLQFSIVQTLFEQRREDTGCVFYIGDPKQAIYSFRGADIYAYLRAAKSVDKRYRLSLNWRSEAPLVHAFNALFTARKDVFVLPEISYAPIQPSPEARLKSLVMDGQKAGAGMRLWFLPAEDDGQPVGVNEARDRITEAMAVEISKLLHESRSGRATLGDAALSAKDIAVLVRTHAEALRVKQAFERAGIASVQQGTNSVFASVEADDFKRFVSGLLRPDHDGYVLTALATPFFALDAMRLSDLHEDDDAMDQWRSRFVRWSEVWRRKGFLPMFCSLLEEEGMREKLARHKDGERKLTNYQHLAQLIQKAHEQESLQASDLPRWFDEMAAKTDVTAEDQQIRLETDRDGVRIVTMHKSKGLEYPVVFCPFCWSDAQADRGMELVYHDENDDWRLTALFDPEAIEEARPRHERENRAEQRRLLYVALTRAKNRCYFILGNIRGIEKSAVSFLFSEDSGRQNQKGQSRNEKMLADLEALVQRSPADIELSRMDRQVLSSPEIQSEGPPEMVFRPFDGRIEQSRKVASYSLLVRRVVQDGSWEDRWDESAPALLRNRGRSKVDNRFDRFILFPSGATPGTLLHEILEKIDLSNVRGEQTGRIVDLALRKFNYDPAWTPCLVQMLDELASARLEGLRETFCLADIPKERCLKEMEFYFPVKEISSSALGRLLSEASPDERGGPEQNRLHFPPLSGFMKGFIDLVFEYKGLYYLGDWKSNDLGERSEDYGPKSLQQEMRNAFYDLQYLIYTVALNQYLKMRVADYRYERHFGGVFYFFLRGLRSGAPVNSGVFFDRPRHEVIRRLETLLLEA